MHRFLTFINNDVRSTKMYVPLQKKHAELKATNVINDVM